MATGNVGIIRPSTVEPKDVQIFYNFVPNRETEPPQQMNELDATNLLTHNTMNGLIGGIYNLQLPSETFNELGIYNIYIRPRQIRTTITDCSTLAQLPEEKGLILDTTNPEFENDLEKLTNNGLVGFRIEYIEDSSLRNNYFTVVTSANRVEPVSQNIGNTAQNAQTYRIAHDGNLLFLTVSPSTSSKVRPNQKPFIGSVGQEIILSNTYFDPIMLEVELTKYDINTVALGIFGEVTKSIEDGVVTYYDENRNIYEQDILYEIKDEFDNTLYEVKQNNQNIDTDKSWDNITEDVNDV